jgi:hypothetical protein
VEGSCSKGGPQPYQYSRTSLTPARQSPDAAGITDFDYHPPAPESEAVPKCGEARELHKDVEATPAVQGPLLLLKGRSR